MHSMIQNTTLLLTMRTMVFKLYPRYIILLIFILAGAVSGSAQNEPHQLGSVTSQSTQPLSILASLCDDICRDKFSEESDCVSKCNEKTARDVENLQFSVRKLAWNTIPFSPLQSPKRIEMHYVEIVLQLALDPDNKSLQITLEKADKEINDWAFDIWASRIERQYLDLISRQKPGRSKS